MDKEVIKNIIKNNRQEYIKDNEILGQDVEKLKREIVSLEYLINEKVKTMEDNNKLIEYINFLVDELF